MTPSNLYRPTEEFRESLEWEVLRRHRRNARAQTHRPPRTPIAKAVVLIVVSASIGATAGFASAQVRQNAARDSLLAVAQAEAMLAKTRLDIAKAEADDVSAKVRVGLVDQETLAAAIAELRDMEARWNASALNVDEIKASGQTPRDDLGAPLVDGRDYVKLRNALQLSVCQAKLTAAEATQANAERRFRAGAEDENVVTSARLRVIRVRGELSVLAERLKLRQEFLERGTPTAQLVQRLETTQLRADASSGQAELDAARARLATVEKMRGVGKATDVDLLRAQLAIKELELELQRLAMRLRTTK
jgi:hypothetical protein